MTTEENWEERFATRHGPVRVLVRNGTRARKGTVLVPGSPTERGWFGQRREEGNHSGTGNFKKGKKR